MSRRTALISAVLALSLTAWAVYPVAAPQDKAAPPTADMTIYRHVVHVGWVVKDLDGVVGYWEKLGLKNIRLLPVQEESFIYQGAKTPPVSFKMAFGDIGGVNLEWIEPVRGESAWTHFLSKHGDGVDHLAYETKSAEQFEAQLKFFADRGVRVLEQGSWKSRNGAGHFAYLDTAGDGGGLTIELLHDPDRPSEAPGAAQNEYPFSKIVQYAFVVRDVKKVGAYYERIGLGGFSIDHNISVDRDYRDQPGLFEMYLGWNRFGDVPFEWVQEIKGPSVYAEYLKAHGEGFHHLAFDVTDMDKAIALFKSKGVAVSQSGGWQSPHSRGRFAYLDTEPYGGVTIELLWNDPTVK